MYELDSSNMLVHHVVDYAMKCSQGSSQAGRADKLTSKSIHFRSLMLTLAQIVILCFLFPYFFHCCRSPLESMTLTREDVTDRKRVMPCRKCLRCQWYQWWPLSNARHNYRAHVPDLNLNDRMMS
jgi:hypothetical protein